MCVLLTNPHISAGCTKFRLEFLWLCSVEVVFVQALDLTYQYKTSVKRKI